jgi:hypothetical protein
MLTQSSGFGRPYKNTSFFFTIASVLLMVGIGIGFVFYIA